MIEFLCIYPDYWLFLLPTIFILEFKSTNLTKEMMHVLADDAWIS